MSRTFTVIEQKDGTYTLGDGILIGYSMIRREWVTMETHHFHLWVSSF